MTSHKVAIRFAIDALLGAGYGLDLFVVVPQGGLFGLFVRSIFSFSVWPFYATLLGMIYAAKAFVI